MKRFIILAFLSLAMSLCPFSMKAGDFGIVGGASFLELKNLNMSKTTGYHAGLTYKFNLPVGFSIQPSLMYHMKAASAEAGNVNVDFKAGYLELPLSIQWGPDLLLFRPFLDVTPFVGYAVNNEFETTSSLLDSARSWENRWDGMNRLEYGLGLGGGIEIWKLQFTARYNWNFGPLFNEEGKVEGWQDVMNNAKTSVFEGKNFGGVTLSLALLF